MYRIESRARDGSWRPYVGISKPLKFLATAATAVRALQVFYPKAVFRIVPYVREPAPVEIESIDVKPRFLVPMRATDFERV
jgi:hypothetical protein